MNGITEKLAELEGREAEVKTRMKELSDQCNGDVDKLSAEELREFDGLNAERDPIEENIKRYRGMIAAVDKAVPVNTGSGLDPSSASRVRQGDFRLKSNLSKGTLFARAVIAKARGRGSVADSISFAKQAWKDTPEVAQYLQIKANAGTGSSGNWAEDLNVTNVIDSEFIELLRPATILGRLAGLRPATFNTKMVRATGGTSVSWVGRAAAKPVGEMAFDFVTIDTAKCAGIVVLTEEQIMISHPNSDQVVSNDLVGQVAQFLDEQFTDPAISAVAGTNPASVTNGVTAVTSSGATANDLRLDLKKALSHYAAANMGVAGLTIITTSYVAMGISLLVNALGQPEFPTVTMNGGTLMGMPIVVSDNVPGSSTGSLLILIKPSEVFLADAGGVSVDVSREATLDMAGGNSPNFNLWQKNCVGLRAERFISWQKRRDAAVQYISGAAYAPAA